MLKSGSVAVLYVRADWANYANAAYILGPAKENLPEQARAFAVRILDCNTVIGLWVVSVVDGDSEGIKMFVPWPQVVTIMWRENMESIGRAIGLPSEP